MCTVPGYVAGQIDPFDGKSWTATASRSAAAYPPNLAIDGDATTRWSTGAPMAAGDTFSVDMGGAIMISSVTYDFGGGTDFPVMYKLELSPDCTTYAQVATGAGAANLNKIAFTKQSARCFRITQTAATGANWWSIYGITVQP